MFKYRLRFWANALTYPVLALVLCLVCWHNTKSRYESVCKYADAHNGRVEQYLTTYGALEGWRVWLPDGSFITDRELERKGEI